MSLFSQIENDIDRTMCRIGEYEKMFDDQIHKVRQWMKEVFENPSQNAKQIQNRGRKRPVIETIPEKNEDSSITEDDDNGTRNSKRHHSDEENILKSPDNSKNVDLKPKSTTKVQNEIETSSKSEVHDQPLKECPKITSDKTDNDVSNSIKKTNNHISNSVKETNQNVVCNSEILEPQPVGRSKRAASQVARLMTSKVLNSNLNAKLRRPVEFNNKFEVQIKEEKMSIVPPTEADSKDEISTSTNKRTRRKKNDNHNNDELHTNVVIKQEKPDKTELATRSRTKQKLKKDVTHDNNQIKNASLDSDDVEIHSVTNELLVVSDSEDETPDKNNDHVEEKQKLDEKIVEKSSNELSEKHLNEQKEQEQSIYEDAVQEHGSTTSKIKSTVTAQCSVQLNRIDDTELNTTYNVANKPAITTEEIDCKSAIKKVVPLNETVVIETNKTPPLLNETVTISQEHKQNTNKNNEQFKKSPVLAKSQNYTTYKNQKLFSPSQGLVKKRVIEIEKLNGSPTPTPTVPTGPTGRVTRTKTRALKAATALATDDLKENIEEQKEEHKLDGKAIKYQKPLQTLRLNDLTSSKTKPANISKINNIGNSSENLLKSLNVLKSQSKTDLRDEELRKKLEKVDVVKKRDAILSAKVEEQKRKREEKALKAQQVREQKEKERQQYLERQERERLEKQKQAQLERELKKKEIERKAALAEQRAKEIEDRRKAEEMARHQRLLDHEDVERKKEHEAESTYQKRTPDETERVYKIPTVNTQTPKKILPRTTLDLNTDDESDEELKRDIPMWSKTQYRTCTAKQQALIHKGALLRLFNSKPLKSINLKRIFPDIELSRLRRDSSAVWRTPPRYSQMKKI